MFRKKVVTTTTRERLRAPGRPPLRRRWLSFGKRAAHSIGFRESSVSGGSPTEHARRSTTASAATYGALLAVTGVGTAVRLRYWVTLALGRAKPASQGHDRYARVARGAATALGNKLIGIAVGFVSVPLTVGYLGAERYGAWITISTTLAWLTMADLGIGNGLTNAIADAVGHSRPELTRNHVATAFWMLTGMMAVVLVVLGASWPFVDWGSLFNVHTVLARREIGPAVALAVALFAVRFPLSLVEKVYVAHQEGATVNYWAAAANLATLTAIVAATRTRAGMVGLVVAYSGTGLLVMALNATWLFGWRKPHLRPGWSGLRRESARLLTATGGRFFVVQVAALVLFSTDNIIIARVLGPCEVTPYSVTYRLFTVPTMFVSLYFPYLWAAYADAFARGDGSWIVRAFRWSALASFAVSAVLVLPLVFLGIPIIRLWAGPAAVPPPQLLFWMAAWDLIFAPANALACMLDGAGRLRGQMYYGILSAAANIVLSVLLARIYGITGVMAATVVSYMVFAAVPVSLEGLHLVRALQSQPDRNVS